MIGVHFMSYTVIYFISPICGKISSLTVPNNAGVTSDSSCSNSRKYEFKLPKYEFKLSKYEFKLSKQWRTFLRNIGGGGGGGRSIRDDPYWTSRKNCFELIELSSINKVSLGFLL